ncbi:hypothetical protein CRENBAI_013208 [Crenichthys baileyi]|uniref:Uncharacterized protein n=1 Tax=Crenichthys baileyi TaxID=28760 RepID=A0AAV9RYI9_9TELE
MGHECYIIHILSLQYFPVQFNKGEHGFDNQEMDMKPFFRAVGPAFHKNLEVGPFETVNIYPLMCHILGIQPELNDGNLSATQHMLVTSADGKTVNFWKNGFIGLSAVAGFLLLVFIVATSYKILQRKRKNKRLESSTEEEKTKKTSL